MNCNECGQPLDTDDPRARFHPACRSAAYRRRKRGASVTERPVATLSDGLAALLPGREGPERETAVRVLGQLPPQRRRRIEERAAPGGPVAGRCCRPHLDDIARTAVGLACYCAAGQTWTVTDSAGHVEPWDTQAAQRARGRWRSGLNAQPASGASLAYGRGATVLTAPSPRMSGDVALTSPNRFVAVSEAELASLRLEARQAREAQVQLGPPSSGGGWGLALLGGGVLAAVAVGVVLYLRGGGQVPDLGLPDVAEAPLTLAQVARYA